MLLWILLSSGRSVVSGSLWPYGPQHARPPCPSPNPRVYSDSCPLSQWCHPPTSSSVIPFSSCLQSFPASGPFQMSQFLASGGQSIRVSASTLVLPVNIQDWFPLEWAGWISLQFKGLSRVFSNTIVEKHQFFGAQLSLWSNPYIRETLAMSERESPYSVVARWCHVKMKAMCYKIFSFFLVQVRNILIGFHVKIPILLKYCSGLKQNVPVGRIWLCVTSLPLCDRWF